MSSENAFVTHNLFNQQNGEIRNKSNRATMESIKSVHENPFYKNFGIRHSAPSYPRPVNNSTALEQSRKGNSNGRSSSFENDDIGEYRPGTGYVHKLLDKFSSLTAKEEQSVPISHLKRSSSLDELPIENEIAVDKPSIPRGRGIGFEKPAYLSAAKLSHRARSIESLNHNHHKSNKSQHTAGHVETKWKEDKHSLSSKSHRDGYSNAPDLDLAREDIIIVESATSFPSSTESDDGVPKIVGSHDVILLNELPKPNTVITVRSIFESASTGSGLYTRRQKSDSQMSPSSQPTKLAFTPHQTQLGSISSPEGVFNQVNLHSPSLITSPRISYDYYTKPTFVPNSSTFSSKVDASRYSSDSRSSTFISSQQVDHGDPDSSVSSHVPSVDGKVYHSKNRSNLEDFSSPDIPHNTVPTYSTTGKVISTGQAPMSPTNSNIHKPTSAVPPSSIKNIIEDSNKDEQPVMILTKSNLSPQKTKPHRIRDYTSLNNGPFDATNENSDQEKQELFKKLEADDRSKPLNETKNKVLSQRQFFDSNIKAADRSLQDQNKIIYAKHHTTIEIKNSQQSNTGKDNVSTEDKSKQAEVKLTKPLALKRTSLPKARANDAPVLTSYSISLSSDNLEGSRTQIKPLLTSAYSSDQDELNSSSERIPIFEATELSKEKSTTSKRAHPEDAPTLNEQPLTKVSKDKAESKKEPVKGIASIVAQRLDKQNYDPSQVATDVRSYTRNFSNDNEDSSNIFSKRHLSPPPRGSSIDNNDKDSLSSEIQNEIAAVRKKMEGSRSKSSGLAPIFDSSQLAKKRKEKKQQQEASSEQDVPSLDLSGITDSMEYQPQQKSIPPCNIIFIGENTKTSRSLLNKQRRLKINIHFNDAKTETFEYPNEEVALEQYLLDHPHEKDEILVLEDFSGVGTDETSDDVEIDVFETPVTPRGNSEDDLLKANTSLSHTGSLQSYRGRYQQDYQLGTITLEQPNKVQELEQPTVDPEKLMLRPAEEDDTNTWSTSSSSDILF